MTPQDVGQAAPKKMFVAFRNKVSYRLNKLPQLMVAYTPLMQATYHLEGVRACFEKVNKV